MGVALDDSIITKILDSIGGVKRLLEDWEDAYGEQEVPDRATVYRWRAGELPKSSINLIRFANLLDVDPFCLLVAEPNSKVDEVIGDVFSAYQLNNVPEPSLQFLADFFGWNQLWPPRYFEEPRKSKPSRRHAYTWHEQEFTHDATNKKNYDALIKLISDRSEAGHRPQTFHFAFGGKSALRQRWLHYGFVVRHKRSVRLIHIHGHTDSYDAKSDRDPTFVETWFGPNPATFRVASRHPFTLEADVPRDQTDRAVRFPG